MAESYVRSRRTRIRGLPQTPAVIRSVPRPFTKGKNTDFPSWSLDPQEFPDGSDFVFPKGLAVPRGPYISASTSGLLIASGSGWLTGVMAADLPSYGGAGVQPGPPVLCAAANTGAIGLINASLNGSVGTASLIGGSQAILPREVYKGEVLFCPQDGVTPIQRFAGAPVGSLTASGGAAGTVTAYQGTSFVLGLGTTFTTQARVGSYIALGGLPGQASLVVSVDDNTHLSVDTVFPITTGVGTPFLTSVTWGSVAPTRLGWIGFCIPVHTLGQISMTTGLGTTVSGFGSLWNTANTPPGQGRPQVGWDFIGPRNYDRLAQIATITNDYTLTIYAAPVADYANKPYLIYRNAMGRECRYHQGRLYITGVDWDPTGVYYLPVNAPLGQHHNTDQPTATITSDFATSQCLLKFDVPIQGAQGINVALLSTPQGLLILRSNGAYLSMGDPPTQQVIEIAHGAGCVDLRSACVGNRGEGAFWVGPNGIYRYVGGRVIDLTDGRRNREWRQKMASFLVNYLYGGLTGYVSCAVLDGHLFVAVNDNTIGANSCLWVYDLNAGCWCGDFSGGSTLSSMSMYQPGSLKTSAGDDVYFTTGATMGGVDRSQALRMGGIARDEGGLGTSALHGTFSADLPESVVGTPNDLSRVTEAKLVYELTGAGATLALSSNVDGGSYGTDATLGVTAAGPQEQRVMPTSDVTAPSAGHLGELGRRHGHRLAQTGTKPSALRIHQIDLVVRPRRPRA